MIRPYLWLGTFAVAVTLLGALYYKGRVDGVSAESLRNAEAVQELNEQLKQKGKELAALETARLERERELESRVEELMEEANADANADRTAIGVGSVRRLNSITSN